MVNEGNRCFRCQFFKRYYTKDFTQYEKTEFGICLKNHKIVLTQDNCEQYVYKKSWKRGKKLVQRCLNDLLIELTEIRNIIEEDYNENKDV